MTIPAQVIKTICTDGRITYDLGRVFDGKQPTADLPAYQDGAFSAPSHGYYQRGTYRSGPLPVKVSPAQIVAANRSFPYGNNPGISILPIPSIVFAGPMDNAMVQKYMPTGGGGSDRCLLTDYSAHFMRTGDAAAMFAQALAADSIPINYVDASTGKPLDLIKAPLTNTYGLDSGVFKPWFPVGVKNAAGTSRVYSGGWAPVTDHFPSLTYHAFQASHDVGLLYNLQFAANFPSIQHPSQSAGPPPKAVIPSGQTRELAWGLRMLFEAHTATKDAEALGILPADLHPSSYFKALLDNNLAYYGKQMADPTRQTFRLLGPDLMVGHWQYDYLLSALSFAVLTGHSDWTSIYLWALGNAIARTNGTSGWPPNLPATYYMYTVPGGLDRTKPQYTWAQAFDDQIVNQYTHISQAEHDAILADPLKLSPHQDSTSLMGCFATIAMAGYLDKKGLASVRATYPEFDTCVLNVTNLMKSYGKIAERFSVVIAPNQVPPVVVPPPVITPPPVRTDTVKLETFIAEVKAAVAKAEGL